MSEATALPIEPQPLSGYFYQDKICVDVQYGNLNGMVNSPMLDRKIPAAR